MNIIEEIAQLIKNSPKIVVISGAGISTASNIPDIRGEKGAANNPDLKKKYGYSYETIVSHSFFMSHPDLFYDYYKNEMVYRNAKPNKAHLFLKKLEDNHEVTIITQNIDGLHTLAGSRNVIEFHGSVQSYHCLNCHQKYDLDYIYSFKEAPHCKKCKGLVKPDVILFEEGIETSNIIDSLQALHNADLLLVIGSSLNVYPAAGLIYEFKGRDTILINKDITPLDSYFKIVVHDDIIKVIENLENVASF